MDLADDNPENSLHVKLKGKSKKITVNNTGRFTRPAARFRHTFYKIKIDAQLIPFIKRPMLFTIRLIRHISSLIRLISSLLDLKKIIFGQDNN